MSMTSKLSTPGYSCELLDDFMNCGDKLTITWNLGESDIHSHRESLSSALIDDNGSLKVHPSVIQELDSCESKDDGGRKKCHCNRLSNT